MKYLQYLLETHLLESYALATKEWAAGHNKNDVDQTINMFKELVNKNKVSGAERDINHWRKAGFDQFKQFVEQTKQKVETADTKGNRKKAIKAASDDILTVKKTNGIHLFIPLSKQASCFYGGNTSWCISTRDGENYFTKYTLEDRHIIFFLIDGDQVFALVLNRWGKIIECRDQENGGYDANRFLHTAGTTIENLMNFVDKHMEIIDTNYEKHENPESKLNELKQSFDTFGTRVQPKNGAETEISGWFNNNFKFFKNGESLTTLKEFCAKSAMAAYYFASHSNKRFIEGESAIARDAKFSFLYAKMVIRGRFEEGELVISNDFDYAVQYATDVLKGRFEKAEPVIARSRRATDEYIDFFDGKVDGEEVENHMMRLYTEWKAKNG